VSLLPSTIVSANEPRAGVDVKWVHIVVKTHQSYQEEGRLMPSLRLYETLKVV
jgi:hypothetical protein